MLKDDKADKDDDDDDASDVPCVESVDKSPLALDAREDSEEASPLDMEM